jgi:HKD family nuclease
MHYEINVAKNGKHVFATHERSLSTLEQTSEVVSRLELAFPKAEGYAISVSEICTIGKAISEDELTKELFKK